MSDADRGAYTPPTDPPLTFDARQPVRGSRPPPVTLIVSAIVLAILLIAIVVFYSSGVRKEGEAPRTVGVPVGEMKAAAPAASQPSDAAAGLQIYQAEKSQAAAPEPKFTPPPEQPAPRAAPAPAPTTPVTRAPAALPPAAKPVELKPAQPAPPPAATVKTAPPATVAPKPAPAKPAPAKVVPPKPATPAPKAAEPKPAAPAATKPAASSGGSAAVQIGAFSSQDQAEQGLADAARIAGGGKGRFIEPIQKGGATLYRTQVTGFASRAEATAYCDKLKAAGKTCFVK